MIKHFATCTDDYPEKPKGELYQAIVEIDIGTMDDPGQKILQCSDCGAFEVKEKKVFTKIDRIHLIKGLDSIALTEAEEGEYDIAEHIDYMAARYIETHSCLDTVEKLGERIERKQNKILRLQRQVKKLEAQVEFLA